MKHLLRLGALKPKKVKMRKTTAHAKGHMPVGGNHKTAKHS